MTRCLTTSSPRHKTALGRPLVAVRAPSGRLSCRSGLCDTGLFRSHHRPSLPPQPFYGRRHCSTGWTVRRILTLARIHPRLTRRSRYCTLPQVPFHAAAAWPVGGQRPGLRRRIVPPRHGTRIYGLQEGTRVVGRQETQNRLDLPLPKEVHRTLALVRGNPLLLEPGKAGLVT